MEAGDCITAGTSVVAAAAACTAWWQTLIARRSARAADGRARAALAHVALVQDQLAHERELRGRADCPLFVVLETDVHRCGGSRELVLVVRQTEGADLAEARITVHVDGAPVHVTGAGADGVVTWRHTAPGADRTLRIGTADRHRGRLELRVDLDCREEDGERRWACRAIGYVRGDGRRDEPHPPSGDDGHPRTPAGPPDRPPPAGRTRVPPRPRAFTFTDDDLPRYPWPPDIPLPPLVHPEDAGLLALVPVAVRGTPGDPAPPPARPVGERRDEGDDDLW
ncbi:hypothetical protein [Streptomyces sp. NPDC002564]|uniref:hypothetical protein n=1 Tax=Streptomyces sp. NPDC002564 TaxID=3364649 RepID=UPI0036CE8910